MHLFRSTVGRENLKFSALLLKTNFFDFSFFVVNESNVWYTKVIKICADFDFLLAHTYEEVNCVEV